MKPKTKTKTKQSSKNQHNNQNKIPKKQNTKTPIAKCTLKLLSILYNEMHISRSAPTIVIHNCFQCQKTKQKIHPITCTSSQLLFNIVFMTQIIGQS